MKGQRELDVTLCRLFDFRLAAHTPKHKSPTPPTTSSQNRSRLDSSAATRHDSEFGDHGFNLLPFTSLYSLIGVWPCGGRIAGKRVLLLYLPMQSIVGG